MNAPLRRWQDITPKEAAERNLDLSKDLSITAPLNELGERCPWPWEPQQLVGKPLGQYRCGYCMGMVVAGVEHIDYAGNLLEDWERQQEQQTEQPSNDN